MIFCQMILMGLKSLIKIAMRGPSSTWSDCCLVLSATTRLAHEQRALPWRLPQRKNYLRPFTDPTTARAKRKSLPTRIRSKWLPKFRSLGIDKCLRASENWVDGRFSCNTKSSRRHDHRKLLAQSRHFDAMTSWLIGPSSVTLTDSASLQIITVSDLLT